MMKEVVRAIETGVFSQIGLFAFLVAFVLILVWAFTMKKADRTYAKEMPLHDNDELLTPEIQ